MKNINWRILIITCIVCLLPMLFGISMWNALPESIAIHFDINNNPDNFASKAVAVFGLPLLMVFLQCVCCITSDMNEHKLGKSLKLITVTKWMIPIMCDVLHTVTLGYALGWNIDIRKFACTIVGVLFVVTGNYLPKLNYVKSVKVDSEKARKINRFVGYETVVLGLLMLFSIFFPPFVSVVCLILLIPYTIIGVVYGIVVGKK